MLEELLVGEEVSLLALCDGASAQPLLAARDYKRVGDADRGPNTGGMGAMAPVPGFSTAEAERFCRIAHEPVLAELERRGARFSGCLYAGLMLTADGPRILEFNVRFGDPETQAILPLLEGDLAAALHAVAVGRSDPSLVQVAPGACVSVVLASQGYPEAPRVGDAIEGVERAAALAGVSVFHSGTALHDGRLLTAGGRVLAISATGADLAAARARAYEAAALVRFDGVQHRSRHRRRAWLSSRSRPPRSSTCSRRSTRTARWSASCSRRSPSGRSWIPRSRSSRAAASRTRCRVLPPHRDPRGVAEYASTAVLRGLRVLICAGSRSASLPGVVAAYTELPVIGVPIRSQDLGGMDALLSIVQQPPGLPVGCMAVNGSRNAAIFAAKILAQGSGAPVQPT